MALKCAMTTTLSIISATSMNEVLALLRKVELSSLSDKSLVCEVSIFLLY